MTFNPLRQEVAIRQNRLAPIFRREMERRLKAAAPKRTRELERSIEVEVLTPLNFRQPVQEIRFQAIATAEYASFTVEGTAPHEIRGNPILAFYWEKVGRFVFFRRVQHPGTKPNPWWPNTLQETAELLRDLWRRL